MMKKQHLQNRQPVSYAELQEVLRTGIFPKMADPVKPGVKPFCYNCIHWRECKDGSGICRNKDARQYALFAKVGFGDGEEHGRYITGKLSHCPLHAMEPDK